MASRIFSNDLEELGTFFLIFILGATARICETVNRESLQREGRLRTDDPDSNCRGCIREVTYLY